MKKRSIEMLEAVDLVHRFNYYPDDQKQFAISAPLHFAVNVNVSAIAEAARYANAIN
jgi:uncharacterized protein with HEPN domain